MPQPALEDFMALNDQVAALIEAGVPMETGLPLASGDLKAQLQAINANVARQVSQGATLDAALAATPPLYGSIVRTALNAGQLPFALQSFHRLAEARAAAIQAATFSVIYPAIVLLLVYLGLVFFCLWLVPTLQEMYFSAGLVPRRALAILAMLRDTLPYWAAFPPLGIAAVVALGRRARQAPSAGWMTSPGGLPGLWRANCDRRAANFAQLLAALLESRMPLEEALSVASGAWDDSNAADSYPPLLKWAIFAAEPALERHAALRLVADTYRASAQRRLDRWTVAAPLALLVVVGGGATLLYGLALFVPIVDLLQGLAR